MSGLSSEPLHGKWVYAVRRLWQRLIHALYVGRLFNATTMPVYRTIRLPSKSKGMVTRTAMRKAVAVVLSQGSSSKKPVRMKSPAGKSATSRKSMSILSKGKK